MMTQEIRPLSRSKAIAQELDKLHRYGCREVLLIDADGLVVSSAPPLSYSQEVAALAARLTRVAQRTSSQADLGSSDEVTVRTASGMKLICRTFFIGDQSVSLVCVLPRDRHYRRITSHAIRAIQYIWLNNDGRRDYKLTE